MLQPELEGLYAITDENLITEDHFGISIEQTLLGGARILQYRDKGHDRAKRLHQSQLARQLCYEYNCLLIINDDVDLAIHCNADGVHLGQEDGPVSEAREILGEEAIIGRSCYDRLDLALKAKEEGADYIAFGAIYPSPTKPQAPHAPLTLITQAKAQLDLPVCAIGGITRDNAAPVIDAGADMVAVISDIFGAPDLTEAAQAIQKQFG